MKPLSNLSVEFPPAAKVDFRGLTWGEAQPEKIHFFDGTVAVAHEVPLSSGEVLSQDEEICLVLGSIGMSVSKIASATFTSHHTIHTRRRSIRRKLEANSENQLSHVVSLAFGRGIFAVEQQAEIQPTMLASKRFSQILHLTAAGMSYKEMANQLEIAEATVKSHVARMKNTTDLRSAVANVFYGYCTGLLSS